MITLFDQPEMKTLEDLYTLNKSKIRFLMGQIEQCEKTGKKHLQIYVELEKQLRLSSLKHVQPFTISLFFISKKHLIFLQANVSFLNLKLILQPHTLLEMIYHYLLCDYQQILYIV